MIEDYLDVIRGDVRHIKESKNLYFRDDPDSRDAWYETEPGEDARVGCSLDDEGKTYEFVWQRSKSNQNLDERNFTFYLTRHAYVDEFRVVDGQSVRNKKINVKTSEGNSGLLCALKLSLFKQIDKGEEDSFYQVLVFVRQEKVDDDRIRIVSCYPTDKDYYVDAYTASWFDKHLYGSKRPDRLDDDDLRDGAVKIQEKRFKYALKVDASFEKRRSEYKKILKDGYKRFQRFIGDKTPMAI